MCGERQYGKGGMGRDTSALSLPLLERGRRLRLCLCRNGWWDVDVRIHLREGLPHLAARATVAEQEELRRLEAVIGAGVKAWIPEDADEADGASAPVDVLRFVSSLDEVVDVIDRLFPACNTSAERKAAVIVKGLQEALVSPATVSLMRSSFHEVQANDGTGSRLVYAAAALSTVKRSNPTVLHQRQLRGDVELYAAVLGRDAVVELLCAMVTRYAAESRDASARAERAEASAEKWTPAALDAAFKRAATAGDAVCSKSPGPSPPSALRLAAPFGPILALSATVPVQDQEDLVEALRLNVPLVLRTTAAADLVALIDAGQPGGCIIVYALQRGLAKKLAEALGKGLQGSRAVFLVHAKLTQSEKEAALNGFRDATDAVLVCTNSAIRGVDHPNVTQIFKFRLPLWVGDDLQLDGRGARNPCITSTSTLLYNRSMIAASFYIIRHSPEAIARFTDVIALAENLVLCHR
ncbi:P-loop containing nucleoside triphosphate hydrolase protein, partial [Pelagophyceae sp. CCMP2097]